MMPSNVDPRRPEKVQRYKPPQANGNAPVEDLTPDYMNILGPDSATANADGIEKNTGADQQQHAHEDIAGVPSPAASTTTTTTTVAADTGVAQTSNGTNVIPTSPQYGVAIITNNTTTNSCASAPHSTSSSSDVPNETTTSSTDSVIETTAKSASLAAAAAGGDDAKDMHSTPSRNDRFKVVKIASLEPFRRGRWKCMDYVDENPPSNTQQPSKQTQSATNIQQMSSMQYMQTQSLPQQHFQQMLVQGAFSGSPQGFYQSVPNPMMPQSQYFYPAQTNLQQVPVQANNMQPAFINNQPYFPSNVVPHSGAGYTTYSNVQYVPPNLIQTQCSAFVPTSQNLPTAQLPANFQQSQTYAGQPSQTQQPMVNGHAFPPNEQAGQQSQAQVVTSLPTQIVKNVILQPAIVSTNPLINQTQQQQQQQYNPAYNPTSIPNPTPQATQGAQGTSVAAVASTIITPVPVVNQLPTQIPTGNPTTATPPGPPATIAPATNQPITFNQMPAQPAYELNIPPTNAVYTNPQFAPSEAGTNDGQGDGSIGAVSDVANNAESAENAGGEDPAKANPVVNAIDNKIEQAMDLVKSHLMYTVREEVEVLKEKIVELMERIQQLETENTYLKQQVSKEMTANGTKSTPSSGTPDAGAPTQPPQQVPLPQQPPQQQQPPPPQHQQPSGAQPQ